MKEVEQLSRVQLRNVLGGFTGGTGPTETDGTVQDCDDPACTQPSDSCQTSDDCGPGGSCDEVYITCCVTRSGGPENVHYFFNVCKNF